MSFGSFTAWAGAFPNVVLNADPQQATNTTAWFGAWSRYDSRQYRYEVLWALFQNNAFWEQLHGWTPALKTRFGLYRHTRGVFNPVHRLGEFWASHLVGGPLDPAAGDGSEVRSALPIETENEAVRKGLARLWRCSRWGIKKDDWARKRAVLGDVALKICDEADDGEVCLEVVHPGHVKWADVDRKGRCRGYLLEEYRWAPDGIPLKDLNPIVDPLGLRPMVRYNEECWVEGGRARFRTYLNGGLFDWRTAPDGRAFGTRAGSTPEWAAPYGFVPLVLTQHLDVGLPYGMAEPHALISKVFEADDVASNEGDQIRKLLNAPWAITGAAPPRPNAAEPRAAGSHPTAGNPQPGRTETDWFYFPSTGGNPVDVKPMVAPMPLADVSQHVQHIIEEIERDYPELQMDIWASGDSSGRALRVARQRVEGKVQARRSGGDEGLVLAQRLALAVGAVRGYEGYEGLATDDPFGDEKLDHAIAHRPVFQPDPMDDVEEGTAFWGMVSTAVQAGMPLATVLRREGWPEEDIEEIEAEKQKESDQALDQVKQRMELAGPEGGQDGGYGGGEPDQAEGDGAGWDLPADWMRGAGA